MTNRELAFVRRHGGSPDGTGTVGELSSDSPSERSPSA
jgi:hypothetical protein